MKTRIKKIIIVAAAMLFLGSGAAFAHEWNNRNHTPPGKAYGQHKIQKHHPGWISKNVKPNPHYSNRNIRKEIRDLRYYYDHGRRPAPSEDLIYKVALKDPNLVFKIIVKEHR
ncbi:MAG: hypothetical protein WBM69_06505 [Desulfobacterales bacterium]